MCKCVSVKYKVKRRKLRIVFVYGGFLLSTFNFLLYMSAKNKMIPHTIKFAPIIHVARKFVSIQLSNKRPTIAAGIILKISNQNNFLSFILSTFNF